MNALTFIETKQIALADALGKGLDIAKPFGQEILLTECQVVGNTFGLTVDPATVVVGTKLKLLRDKRNSFDKNSIVIKDVQGNRLGFVPMAKNEILARLLEAGKDIYAVVAKCDVDVENNIEICVKIYMGA